MLKIQLKKYEDEREFYCTKINELQVCQIKGLIRNYLIYLVNH